MSLLATYETWVHRNLSDSITFEALDERCPRLNNYHLRKIFDNVVFCEETNHDQMGPQTCINCNVKDYMNHEATTDI